MSEVVSKLVADVVASSSALENDDFDAALATIMDSAGITSGDVAGMFFSRFDDANAHWAELDTAQRAELVKEYIDFEGIYARG